MHAATLLPAADTAIILLPLFALLALWMFALDEGVAAPRSRTARRHFCRPGSQQGPSAFSDPDGRPSHTDARVPPAAPTPDRIVEISPPQSHRPPPPIIRASSLCDSQ